VPQALKIFVDSNVLFSKTLRDWMFLLRLETGPTFRIYFSEDVLAETLYRFRRQHPQSDGGIVSNLRRLLVDNMDECVSSYDMSVSYDGVDPNDLHVNAAAIASRVDIVLTADQGFAKLSSRQELPYSTYSCDEFFLLIEDNAALAVQRVVARQQEYWSQREGSGTIVKTLTVALSDAGCPQFAFRVSQHLSTLDG